jgi:light-regulated signal transduction histidine kinase (bacteriophytochrome)
VIARIRALTKKKPFQKFQKEQLDINDVVLEVTALTRTEMDRNRLELSTQLARDLPPVQADRIELQQLVLNLIINSIEPMSDGARRDLLIVSTKDDANCVRCQYAIQVEASTQRPLIAYSKRSTRPNPAEWGWALKRRDTKPRCSFTKAVGTVRHDVCLGSLASQERRAQALRNPRK